VVPVSGLTIPVEECIREKGENPDDNDPYYLIIFAILKAEIRQLFRSPIRYTTQGIWFFTHLCDLLYHANKLKYVLPTQEKETIRERFVVEYCTQLMNNQGFTHIVVSYLYYACPVYGSQYTKLAILSTPIYTERDAKRFLSLCRNYKVDTDTITTIHRIVANRLQKRGQYCSALCWYREANDMVMTSALSNAILMKGERSKSVGFQDEAPSEIVKPIESAVQNIQYIDAIVRALEGDHFSDVDDRMEYQSRRLDRNVLFLNFYHKMLLAYKNKDYQAASLNLLKCLQAHPTPQPLWLILLLDAVHLIKNHNVVFGTNGCYQLMECLNDFSMSSWEESDKQQQEGEEDGMLVEEERGKEEEGDLDKKSEQKRKEEEQFQLIRAALAQNLAKSITTGYMSGTIDIFLEKQKMN